MEVDRKGKEKKNKTKDQDQVPAQATNFNSTFRLWQVKKATQGFKTETLKAFLFMPQMSSSHVGELR